MALGYCLVCERLVAIEPREYKVAGSRERAWYPVFHTAAFHDTCGGVIVDGECKRCQKPVLVHYTTHGRCHGVKKAI